MVILGFRGAFMGFSFGWAQVQVLGSLGLKFLQRLDSAHLQDQPAHAGVAGTSSVRRLQQGHQAVSYRAGVELSQGVAGGPPGFLVFERALAGEGLAHPFVAHAVLSGEGSGGHPPVVQVHKVVGIDPADELARLGGVGARPSFGDVVEEVGGHGGDCTVQRIKNGNLPGTRLCKV